MKEAETEGGLLGSRRRRVVAGSVAALAVAVIAVGVSMLAYANGDPNQGWDTKCGDFLKMTAPERVDVMDKAGMAPRYAAGEAKELALVCRAAPWLRDASLADVIN